MIEWIPHQKLNVSLTLSLNACYLLIRLKSKKIANIINENEREIEREVNMKIISDQSSIVCMCRSEESENE